MPFPQLPDGDLRLPDLQQWITHYGGYDRIPPEAWAHWENTYEA
jgi:hypothetical protein